MKDSVVKVENLNFVYKIRHGNASSLKQTFINFVKGTKSEVEVVAIKGISFELRSGEILGIIGNNGAGKSTLLKLIAGILPPLSGVVNVNGQIAPLIELNAGFNPELTGAENIVLFGVLLGNSRLTMEQNIESIAVWAGLTDCIDLPIRTYSSGMKSRLGFAVATFQRNELLIIDEILSVGDAEFQKKSLVRLDELIAAGEVTILVSHDLDLVEAKTTKVLWLERGRQIMFGNSNEVINAYRKN